MNYYEILEISPSSSLDDIKKAYHRLALKYHPDVYKEDSAKFNLIKEAYDSLIQNYNSNKKKEAAADFHDLFSEMFTSLFGTVKKQTNLTHSIKLGISLKEAISGVNKTLKIKFDIPCSCGVFTKDNCRLCHGLGYTSEESVINLEFKNIQMQNQEFIFKKIYKDITLKVIISISPLDNLKIKGSYLEIEENLNIFKAIAGGDHTILTPLGEIKVNLPYGNISNFYLAFDEISFPWKPIKINFKLFLPEPLTTHQKALLNNYL